METVWNRRLLLVRNIACWPLSVNSVLYSLWGTLFVVHCLLTVCCKLWRPITFINEIYFCKTCRFRYPFVYWIKPHLPIAFWQLSQTAQLLPMTTQTTCILNSTLFRDLSLFWAFSQGKSRTFLALFLHLISELISLSLGWNELEYVFSFQIDHILRQVYWRKPSFFEDWV